MFAEIAPEGGARRCSGIKFGVASAENTDEIASSAIYIADREGTYEPHSVRTVLGRFWVGLRRACADGLW